MTSIASVRLTSAQIFMRTFKDNSEQAQSDTSGLSNSMSAALLREYNVDTSDDGYDTGIYSLLDSLGAGDSAADTTEPEEISGDIGSASFMAGLKEMLEQMKATPDGKARAQAMLDALEDGTLTVTDAVNGRQIKAWDVDAEAEKKTENKPTTAVPEQNWTDFLKSRLTRERNASYAHSETGAYIDKVTGENSHFRTVGDTYVYLSWPAAKTTA